MGLFDFMFSKEKTVLYLDRQSLTVLSKKGQLLGQLNFPNTVVSFLDVLDSTQLTKILYSFLHTQKLKGALALVLGNNLLFNAKVQNSLAQNPEELNKTIISNIPFPFQNIAIRQINLNDNNETYVMATNRIYYQVIIKALVDFGLKVESVVPEIAFELSTGNKIPQNTLPYVINKEKKLVELTNYLA